MFIEILVALLILPLTIFFLLKFLMNPYVKPLHYENDIRLDGKTVLITGATAGIGKATAFEFAERGARIILACRNRQKAELTCEEIRQKTGNDNLAIVDINLSDLDSVKSAADEVNKSESRLDVLINNAAVGLNDDGSTKQGFDFSFGTNYIGPFLLTHLLLDLIKKSAPSRIINVTSKAVDALSTELDFSLHSEGSTTKYSKLSGYIISKLGNIYHTYFLSEELSGSRVTINSMNPGFVKTDIMLGPVENPFKYLINTLCKFVSVFISRSPKDAAQTLVYMAVDPELSELTGEYVANLSIQTHTLNNLARNKEQAWKMREISYLACKDYLDLPEDIVNVEEVGAVIEGSSEKEEKDVDEKLPQSTTSVSCESSTAENTEKAAVAEARAAETAATGTTLAVAAGATIAATTAAATETVTAVAAETTKIPEQKTNVFSESNLPTSPNTFTTSLPGADNNNTDLESVGCLISREYSPTNTQGLIHPEITEMNESYPLAESDTNCDTTHDCSNRTSSSREDSPLITIDDTETSDFLHHEEETF